MQRRLQGSAWLLGYAASIGVDYIAFENLLIIKYSGFTEISTANRKMARFAKRELNTAWYSRGFKVGL